MRPYARIIQAAAVASVVPERALAEQPQDLEVGAGPPRDVRAAIETIQPASSDDYFQRVIKLIPSEVLSVYVAGRSSASAEGLPWWALFCLIATIILRAAATRAAPNAPLLRGLATAQWRAVAAAMLSFVIWLYAFGGWLPWIGQIDTWIASLAVLGWGLLAPVLVTGGPPPKER